MARKKNNETEDFTHDLIKSLNKEHGSRVAYNLAYEESPTHVKRWISTGSKQLDYIISDICLKNKFRTYIRLLYSIFGYI